MTSETIKVKVLESRQVADDLYVVGEVVEMAPERALRYAGYFQPLEEIKSVHPKAMSKGALIDYAAAHDIDIEGAANNQERVALIEMWLADEQGE